MNTSSASKALRRSPRSRWRQYSASALNCADALGLVVSEETGAISLARDGVLTRNVTESQIRAHLAGTMDERVPLVGRLLKRHT